jgi:exopolysaccharide production protein ExoQ
VSAAVASPAIPFEGALGRVQQAAIVCATYLPIVFMAYALVVWPLAFGSSEVDLSEQVLGWLVNPPPKDDSVLKQIPYPMFFLVSSICLVLSGSYRRLPLRSPFVLLLAAFVGLATASYAWSVFPADSFKRGVLCGLIIATLLFAVTTARDYGTIARGLFWTLFAAALFNVAAIFLKPPSPIGYTGIYPHKNFFGFVSALILYFGIHGFALGGWLYRSAAVVMLILAPPFLLASGSKTSAGLAGLAPLIALALCALRRRTGVPPLAVVAVPLVLLPLAYWIGREAGLWDFALLAETLLGSATLTGRTDIWAIAGDLISERPWLGWGYEAVWAMGPEGEVTKRAVGFVRTMPTAHNGYIDIFTQLGFVGLVLVLATIVVMFRLLGKLIDTNTRLGWFYGTLLIFILLHNNLESDILISSNQLSMILLFYSFIALRTIGEGRHIEAAPDLGVSHPSPPVLRQE